MVELIITEKPQAAQKIADSLCEGKPLKENMNGVPYYKITRGKKDIIVACAVGHLYGLDENAPNKQWKYPVFDIGWQPSHEAKKQSAYTKKYLMTIKKLAKQADEFTVATDYDIEGEVIGLNVIRYGCNKKDANRMKFSTLTKDDLIKAYEDKSKTLDWGQATAGETRHFLDWYNGINYSRALTKAINSTGAFKIMSIGRVQGPALKIVVDREKEIKEFKPEPYWQIQLSSQVKESSLDAWHEKDKFWDKKEADTVMQKVQKEKEGKISKLEISRFNQSPPLPFDLTTLQTEVYRCHNIAPKNTLEIAQELYTSGYISYPRTSSQQYPESIGYKKIIESIAKNKEYTELAKKLLEKKSLKPNNGKKSDPAHPAIYPTGNFAELDGKEKKVYDLIVRRFLSTFSEPAVRETNKITISVKEEPFISKGTRTIEKGWHVFYGPYVELEEAELPKVKENDVVKVKKFILHDKQTQPPKRFTPASIIRDLEKRNLGTKATRAQIIETLFQRGYVKGKVLEATELGIRTIETLQKYSPQIVDEELTTHFEDEMEEIRSGNKKGSEVLSEAKEALTRILDDFKTKEKEIGKELQSANMQTKDAMITLGDCPVCKEGKLQMRRGKFGQFVACNRYPDCKTTFSLPAKAFIKPANAVCEACSYPMVQVIKKGKQPMNFCINPACKSKKLDGEAGAEAKAIENGDLQKPCSKCKTGKMVLRRSIYGTFLGCSNYPKCKNIEPIGPKREPVSKEAEKQ